MPIKVLMPALSPTMTDGNLAKWLKKEGDRITAGEVIAEIETDKATMEVEAVDEGILARIVVLQGTEGVPVNSLIAVLLGEDEENTDIDSLIAGFAKPSSATGHHPETQDHPKTQDYPERQSHSEPASKSTGNRIFASPLAKRIAKDRGISLVHIKGSGPGGRIVKADIDNFDQQKNSHRGIITRHPEEYKLVPNSNMRKIIAKRLVESKQTVPHFYLSIECQMDLVITVREQINANLIENQSKISINDFVIMAAAKALKEVPAANSSWSDNAILMYNNIDISVAVAVDGGLITPIIRNADQKDIFGISSEMKELARKAKQNLLTPEEFQGGGFSISNLGMYGVKQFSAIVNPPQGCILAVGMSSKRAVITDQMSDKIEIKTMMDVTLSCDHRVVDGAVGAMFLAAFKKYIEAPILMFI